MLILASGPSGKQPWGQWLAEYPELPVMAVNGAIDGLPVPPRWWITLDPSPVNRSRMAMPRTGTTYLCAVPSNYGTQTARPADLRGPRLPYVKYLNRLSGGVSGLPVHPDTIHTGNSGFAGLQAAVHLTHRGRPVKIGIVGVDCTGDGYWHGNGKPARSLAGVAYMFGNVADELKRMDIEVRVGSVMPRPALSCFPVMHPREIVEWLAC